MKGPKAQRGAKSPGPIRRSKSPAESSEHTSCFKFKQTSAGSDGSGSFLKLEMNLNMKYDVWSAGDL